MELTTPRLNGLKSEGKRWHVAIVGGGFGGLRAAQALLFLIAWSKIVGFEVSPVTDRASI